MFHGFPQSNGMLAMAAGFAVGMAEPACPHSRMLVQFAGRGVGATAGAVSCLFDRQPSAPRRGTIPDATTLTLAAVARGVREAPRLQPVSDRARKRVRKGAIGVGMRRRGAVKAPARWHQAAFRLERRASDCPARDAEFFSAVSSTMRALQDAAVVAASHAVVDFAPAVGINRVALVAQQGGQWPRDRARHRRARVRSRAGQAPRSRTLIV